MGSDGVVSGVITMVVSGGEGGLLPARNPSIMTEARDDGQAEADARA